MAFVDIPAAASPKFISNLRSHRSTNIPANNAAINLGIWVKRIIKDNDVALPVIFHAQIVIAKLVISEPSIEAT